VLKKLVEIACCIVHPVAVVLIWVNLLRRGDVGLLAKLVWGVTAWIPLVPFIYVLTGNEIL
jgi:hypothetical protein